MHHAGLDPLDGNMLDSEQCVGSAVVEECPLPAVPDDHNVGVRRGSLVADDQRRGVDTVIGAIALDESPVGVVADEPDRLERNPLAAEVRTEPGDLEEAIIRSPSGTAFFAENIVQRLFVRPAITNVKTVDNPTSASGDTASFLIHRHIILHRTGRWQGAR